MGSGTLPEIIDCEHGSSSQHKCLKVKASSCEQDPETAIFSGPKLLRQCRQQDDVNHMLVL